MHNPFFVKCLCIQTMGVSLLALVSLCGYVCKGTAEIYLFISWYKQTNTIYFIEMEIVTQFERLCHKSKC